ncbi:hypothetical protein JCM8547_005278 [Rhodosporidiobolus lusitaniae]
MLANSLLLSLLATVAFARPGSDDYGKSKDDGKDIFVNNEASTSDNQEEVSYKEVCYRNLYADVDKFKQETEKEVKVSDEYGKDVFFFDSFKKDENDVEFYYREYCYKDFSFEKHDDDESRQTVLDVSKRSFDDASTLGTGLGDSSLVGSSVGIDSVGSNFDKGSFDFGKDGDDDKKDKKDDLKKSDDKNGGENHDDKQKDDKEDYGKGKFDDKEEEGDSETKDDEKKWKRDDKVNKPSPKKHDGKDGQKKKEKKPYGKKKDDNKKNADKHPHSLLSLA